MTYIHSDADLLTRLTEQIEALAPIPDAPTDPACARKSALAQVLNLIETAKRQHSSAAAEHHADPDQVTIISNGRIGNNQTCVMVNGSPMPQVTRITLEMDARTLKSTAVIHVIKPVIRVDVHRKDMRIDEEYIGQIL